MKSSLNLHYFKLPLLKHSISYKHFFMHLFVSKLSHTQFYPEIILALV